MQAGGSPAAPLDLEHLESASATSPPRLGVFFSASTVPTLTFACDQFYHCSGKKPFDFRDCPPRHSVPFGSGEGGHTANVEIHDNGTVKIDSSRHIRSSDLVHASSSSGA